MRVLGRVAAWVAALALVDAHGKRILRASNCPLHRYRGLLHLPTAGLAVRIAAPMGADSCGSSGSAAAKVASRSDSSGVRPLFGGLPVTICGVVSCMVPCYGSRGTNRPGIDMWFGRRECNGCARRTRNCSVPRNRLNSANWGSLIPEVGGETTTRTKVRS